jgi:hypothetical protein
MHNGSMFRRGLILLLVLLTVSCARLPDGGFGAASTRLIFRVRMKGAINPNFVYMVALRPSNEVNPPELGPIPVIAPPWGNGFVAGEVTHFVQWSDFLSPKYQIFEFREGTDLIEFRPIGVPVLFSDVGAGATEIEFELNLDQLADPPADAVNFRSLQINFLTMDRIPQGSVGTKNWDALGDGRLPQEINSPITVPLRISGIYNNQTLQFIDLEPEGDVIQANDPALDIIEWEVEVRFSQ